MKKLNLGCGSNTPNDWLNLDGSWNAWLAKYPLARKLLGFLKIVPSPFANIGWNPSIYCHDVRKPFPFQDNFFIAIYASHLLEHLYLEQGKKLLKECYRILQPGGILRMVVPDLEAIVAEYIESSDMAGRADILNKKLFLREPTPPSGNFIYRIYTVLTDFHSHKWIYDGHSLMHYFESAGFVDVSKMSSHQSRIKDIEIVENPERILNGKGVCVEGLKPLRTGSLTSY